MDVREKTANEKRLIDYYYLAEKIECPGEPLVYWDDIEAAPTVDAVEVVRCRECKFRSSWMMNRNLKYICPESGMFPNGENDFCSYGERKEGADNEP